MNTNTLVTRIASCVLSAMLVLSFFVSFTKSVCAEDSIDVSYEKDGVTLTGITDGETVTITGSNSSQSQFYDVDIPDTIDGIPVCSISANAFQGNAFITAVSLPDGVTDLPDRAFYGCTALNTVNLNMAGNTGSEIDGYTVLGETWSLETIIVAEDNPNLTVYEGVLFNKDMSTLLLYPTIRPGKEYEVPDNVTVMLPRAFNRTQELEEVTLSDGISYYYNSFFRCPALKTLNLNMLANINGYNFTRCYAISTVTVSDNNEHFVTRRGVLFSKDMKELLFYPPGRDEVSYTIPKGVEKIGSSAFKGCVLRQLLMPDSLKVVEGYAFAYAEQLTELIFPDGLDEIMTNACTGCASLAAVYVPDSVTVITAGSLDGPVSPPYAVIYGHTRDANGEYTAAYQYVSDHADEYVFKDIDQEKMPQALELNCWNEIDMDEDFSECQIEADCLASLIYESDAPDIVSVDGNGLMTAHYDGTATITVKAPADAYHDEQTRTVTVNVTGLGSKPQPVDPGNDPGSEAKPQPVDPGNDPGSETKPQPVSQKITGKTRFTKNLGCKAFPLNQTAKTALKYRSSNTKVAKVSKTGTVRILRPGTVKIYITAAASEKYCKAKKTVTIKAVLKKPSFKINIKGTKVKLTWSKVPKAKGYEIYVRFPGKKKYEKVLTESASVKSVTHRGLTKGKTYRYKVRAFTKIDGKKYYSAFSTIRKAKIR